MLPERPLSKRDAARLGLGALVFGVAFAVAATLPDRLHLPYVEPMVGLLALALLVAAALSRAPRRVRVGYRRGTMVGFGLLVGWLIMAVWRPPTEPLVLLVPLIWLGLASAESARSPSLSWSLGIASAPALGVTTWVLQSEAERHGSWWALASRLWTDGRLPRVVLEETTGVLLLFGVTPGIVAYLVGRWWHGTDDRWPERPAPDDRTVALAAAVLLATLLGVRLLLR